MTSEQGDSSPKEKYNMLVLMPMGDRLDSPTFLSCINLIQFFHDNGWDISFATVTRSAHASARNKLSETAVTLIRADPTITHVLWLDSDHNFPPINVYQLIKIMAQYKLDTVSATYFMRTNEMVICALAINEKEERDGKIYPINYTTLGEFKLNYLYEVDAVGFGMFLMRPDVLTRMQDHYGKVIFEFAKRGDHLIGEDVTWCEKAKAIGIKTHMHSGIIIGHNSMVSLDLPTVQALSKYKSEMEIEGWLSPHEADMLTKLAGESGGRGVIVEIGSWKGKSTSKLARGSKAGNGAVVYAIDTFEGSPEHQVEGTKIDTFTEFNENMMKIGMSDIVKPIRMDSVAAAKVFNEPIELLFIDGDHSYKAVKDDFNAWYPKVIPGGIIAFHDTINFEGPNKVVNEEILNNDRFTDVKMVDSMVYARKVK